MEPVGFEGQRCYAFSEENDFAFEAPVAGVAEFEPVCSFDSLLPDGETCGYRFVEKLEIGFEAGSFPGSPRYFVRAKAVEPEPDQEGKKEKCHPGILAWTMLQKRSRDE